MKKAINAPFQQICTNAGRAYKDYLPSFYNKFFGNRVIDDYGIGYNAITDEVSNLIEDGVIDSKYSIRVALENAKSVAKLLSNVRVVIT
jgi:chaperonin GroEL (HSP60 family)